MALSEAFLELQPPTLRSSLGFLSRQSLASGIAGRRRLTEGEVQTMLGLFFLLCSGFAAFLPSIASGD
jgi:hypothetical protein